MLDLARQKVEIYHMQSHQKQMHNYSILDATVRGN